MLASVPDRACVRGAVVARAESNWMVWSIVAGGVIYNEFADFVNCSMSVCFKGVYLAWIFFPLGVIVTIFGVVMQSRGGHGGGHGGGHSGGPSRGGNNKKKKKKKKKKTKKRKKAMTHKASTHGSIAAAAGAAAGNGQGMLREPGFSSSLDDARTPLKGSVYSTFGSGVDVDAVKGAGGDDDNDDDDDYDDDDEDDEDEFDDDALAFGGSMNEEWGFAVPELTPDQRQCLDACTVFADTTVEISPDATGDEDLPFLGVEFGADTVVALDPLDPLSDAIHVFQVLVVRRFPRDPATGEPGQLERSGCVQVGDVLFAINGTGVWNATTPQEAADEFDTK